MGLIEFSLKRRVTVSMMAVALIVFGMVAFTRLPINLLPDISYPTLTVETKFPGAAPGEVESLISRPVEEAVGVVAGVTRVTSVSRPGVSQVTLEFGWGRNMDFASIDVREKLDLVVLPREAEKSVLLRFDPANDPVIRLYVTGADNLYQLRYVAEEVLKKDLESTEGVAAIKVNGGYEEEIQVKVDQGKLALLGLSIQDVNTRLLRENVNQAGGSLYESEARYLVRARNEFQGLDDILETILVSRDGRNVMMSDVATVERGHKQRDVVTRFNGEEAVELALYKEGDANVVSVARSIKARLERVHKELPAGIKVVSGSDQSRFIEASIRQVIGDAMLGGAIAILVLLFFLKDLRSTLIIGVSIPISIIATFFLMYQTGTSLNIMSLGGLALGVGMLVDNAIVVLESIYKRRERGEAPLAAALGGAQEVGKAVVAATVTTVVVFVPIVFVEGVAAQLFWDQALTVSFSLMASLVVSLTLIPMMAALTGIRKTAPEEAAAVVPATRAKRAAQAALVTGPAAGLRWLRRGSGGTTGGIAWLVKPLSATFDGALALLMRIYPPALKWALAHPALVLGLALVMFTASVLVIPTLGVDMVPTMSQGEFSFMVHLPEGTPLEATDRFMQGIQSVLKDDPAVDSYASIVGGSGLSLTQTGTEGENAAKLQVRLKPASHREDEARVSELLRRRLEAAPEARFKFERPTYFTFRTPIEVQVWGERLDDLHAVSEEAEKRLAGIEGLVDVKSSMQLGNPELQISFQREQLTALGLDLFQVASTVRNKVQGEVATRYLEGDREIDILVRSLEQGEASVEDVGDLIIGHRNGVPIFLKSVATVKVAEGPSEIRRIGQNRAVVIAGNLSGRDMGGVAADVRSTLAGMSLPAGVTADLSGQEEEMQKSFQSLMLAMALAIFLVYMVMACEFESILHPFVVMFTVPLGTIGFVLSLMLTGHSIDVMAIIGAMLLAGIVVDNAIVLIDRVNQLRENGMSKAEALLQGGLQRMRPILMTTATTILGLLPMALGLGEGGELQAPMAITVIGGLALGTVLTLVVIPVVYMTLDRKLYLIPEATTARQEVPAGSGREGGSGGGLVPDTVEAAR
ncbi:MAG: efflux RND transporter permease subunit [Candidatus Polarisedimenticolia bacterium]